ncbi:hypothetical protein J416_02861 [Gracilibacillus halophilus YIM-C55.5]|uniref:Ribosomal processing cysteine protease Prp n=1 Tax=Gracilibacillus halophilus YIM-C55.5 TaxID=1308866 RepID=N4WUD5_9BACI|nr:ribosomal-processing cysteine protease Prp [Gracilibacillus halophilus]ENH97960.1 hypothetical protein J416_02861 [Gracilibacillus halophilus YIM-C55.5]
MIQVLIERKNHDITAYTVKGHADSGPYGHDLVCAAVSAITFGAANAVSELCEIDLYVDQAGDEGGYLHIAIPSQVDEAILKKAAWLLEGMLVSLQSVESEYGQFLSIAEQ